MVVKSLILKQFLLGFFVVLLVIAIKQNINSAVSGLLGLICAILPNIVYAKVAFIKRIDYPNKMLGLHKKAMLLKFVSTVVMFATIFVLYRHCDSLMLILTFIVSNLATLTNLMKDFS